MLCKEWYNETTVKLLNEIHPLVTTELQILEKFVRHTDSNCQKFLGKGYEML